MMRNTAKTGTRSGVSLLTIAALLLVAPAVAPAAPQVAGAVPPVKTVPSATTAAPVVETKDQIKARQQSEKAAAKAAKDAEKADAKAKRDAERAARPKKTNGLANCLLGSAVAVGLTAIFGGKGNDLLKAAAAGCVAGWGLGEALKGQDEKRLNTYLSDDYIERDDMAKTSWSAPESGQTLTVETTGEEYKTVKHTVSVDNDVLFDPANLRVSVRKMRVVEAVSLRTEPRAAPDTVKGSFRVGDIVKVYGETLDGKYSYLMETGMDGSPVIVGYGNSSTLSANLQATSPTIYLAKHTVPSAKKVARVTRVKKGQAAASPPPPVAMAAAPPRKLQIAAITRCKNVRVSTSAGKSGSQSLCGGGTNVA